MYGIESYIGVINRFHTLAGLGEEYFWFQSPGPKNRPPTPWSEAVPFRFCQPPCHLSLSSIRSWRTDRCERGRCSQRPGLLRPSRPATVSARGRCDFSANQMDRCCATLRTPSAPPRSGGYPPDGRMYLSNKPPISWVVLAGSGRSNPFDPGRPPNWTPSKGQKQHENHGPASCLPIRIQTQITKSKSMYRFDFSRESQVFQMTLLCRAFWSEFFQKHLA